MAMATSLLPQDQQRDRFAWFLILSIIVHVLMLLFVPLFGKQQLLPPQEQLTEVELLSPPTPPQLAQRPQPPTPQAKVKEPPPQEKLEKPAEEKQPQQPIPLPREQIVSPPDNANDQTPEKTRLLSDRNSTTKEESVAVGNPQPAAPQKEKPQPQTKPSPQPPPTQLAMKTPEAKSTPKPPIEKTIEKALEKSAEKPRDALNKEDLLRKDLAPGKPDAPAATPKLFADPDDLLAQGWIDKSTRDKAAAQEAQHSPQARDLLALAPPPVENPFSLPGTTGTPDLLPDIRQGSVTLLNTKANKFAPFVRRVALRVFQHLLIYQRKQLKIDDIVAAHEMATVQVKLDTQGNLKKMIIQTRSGSYAVDSSLLDACKQGAWDENPPAEAVADDGFINFVFRSNITPQYDQMGIRAIITYLQIGLL
jgi:hypothetical protein